MAEVKVDGSSPGVVEGDDYLKRRIYINCFGKGPPFYQVEIYVWIVHLHLLGF